MIDILGAQGYIGHGICKDLTKRGTNFRAIDIRKGAWGTPEALELNKDHDIRKWCVDDFSDTIVFLSSLHMEPEGLKSAEWYAWQNTNDDIHEQVIECAAEGKRVIFTGSSRIWVDETSAYATVKLATMQRLLPYPNATTVILGTVYGGPTFMRPTTKWNRALRSGVEAEPGGYATSYVAAVNTLVQMALQPCHVRSTPVFNLAMEISNPKTQIKHEIPMDHNGGPTPQEHPTLQMARLLDLPHPDRKAKE